MRSIVLPVLLFLYTGYADRCGALAAPSPKSNPDPTKRGPSPEAPLILENPRDIIAIRGEGGRFYCRASGYPAPQIKWLKDGHALRDATNRFTMPTGEIVFHRIRSSDEGTYQCLAWNSVGEITSRNASLRIAFIKEDFRVMPKDTVAEVGRKVIIECSGPRGLPEPSISWRKDDRQIGSVGTRLQVVGGDLIISDARKSDAGTYQCVATNDADTRTSLPVLLAIQEPPYFVIKPEDKSVIAGREVELVCEARGDPKPRIRWTRTDLTALPPRVVPMSNGNLRITNVEPSDEGGYTCNAENRLTLITATAYIDVKVPPVFVRFPKNVIARTGTTIVLPCSAEGIPMPTLLWHGIEGPNMFPDRTYQDGHKIVSKSGDLKIYNVRFSDEGLYTCQAIGAGGPITASATLTVLSRKSNINPPIIRQGPGNATVTLGHAFELRCTTSAMPTPDITWTKDGSRVISSWNRFAITATGGLKITDVQETDAGRYTCTATNDFGWSHWDAWIKVSDKAVTTQAIEDAAQIPGRPSSPTLLNATSSSLTLRWQPNPNTRPSVTGYVLEYYCLQSESASWVTVAQDILRNTFTVKGLDASSSFVFLVRAVNEHGVSDPSDVSYVINTRDQQYIHEDEKTDMFEKLDEVSVRILEARPIPPGSSSGGISLVWKSSATCKLIDGYFIYVQPVSVQDGAIIKEIAPCYAKSQDLNGLNKRTTFEVRIRPYRRKYEGTPSPILLVSTESEGTSPRAPTLNVRNVTYSSDELASATFSWTSPAQILPKYVNQYTLRCYDKSRAAGAYDQTLKFNSSVNAVTLNNLPRGRDYVALLLFSTRLGVGVYSPKKEFSVTVAAVQSDVGLPSLMKHPGILAAIAASVLFLIGIIIAVLLYRRHRRNRKNRGLHGIARTGISVDPVSKQPQYAKGFTMSIMDGNGSDFCPGGERSNQNDIYLQRQNLQQRSAKPGARSMIRNTSASLNSDGNIGTSLLHDAADIPPKTRHTSSFSYVADQLTSMSSIPPQFSSPDTARTLTQAIKATEVPQSQHFGRASNRPTCRHADEYKEQNTGQLLLTTADEPVTYNIRDKQLPPPPPSPPLSQKTTSDRTYHSRHGTGSSSNRSSGNKHRSAERSHRPVRESFPTDAGTGIDKPPQMPAPFRELRDRAVIIPRTQGYTCANNIPMFIQHPNDRRGDGIVMEFNTLVGNPSHGYLTDPSEGETESEGCRRICLKSDLSDELRNVVTASSASVLNAYDSDSDSFGLCTPPSSIESLNMESASQVGVGDSRMMSATQDHNSSEQPTGSGFVKSKSTRPQQRREDSPIVYDGNYHQLQNCSSPPANKRQAPPKTFLLNRVNSASSSSSSSYHHNTADSGLGAGGGSCGHNSLNSSSSADSSSKGHINRSRTTGSLSDGNLGCFHSGGYEFARGYFSSTERRYMPPTELVSYHNLKRRLHPARPRRIPAMGTDEKVTFDSGSGKDFPDSHLSSSLTEDDEFSTDDKQPTLSTWESGGDVNDDDDPLNENRVAFLTNKSVFLGQMGKAARGRLRELSDVPEASTSDFCEEYSDRSL